MKEVRKTSNVWSSFTYRENAKIKQIYVVFLYVKECMDAFLCRDSLSSHISFLHESICDARYCFLRCFFTFCLRKLQIQSMEPWQKCLQPENEPMEASFLKTTIICALLISFACISFLFTKRSSPQLLRTLYHQKTTSSLTNNALPQNNVQQRKLTLTSSHPSNSPSNSPPYLLFVHIPKTGGTAIEDAPLDYGFSWGRFMLSPSQKIRVEATNRNICPPWHIPPSILFNDNIHPPSLQTTHFQHPISTSISIKDNLYFAKNREEIIKKIDKNGNSEISLFGANCFFSYN